MAQLAEQLICNQQVNGSSPFIGFMDGFPSGQRGQTVNLLQLASMVRIHHHPLYKNKSCTVLTRGGAVWKLVGLITRRSQVQILSPLFHQNAQIAQLVEQRTENPRVAGSIPALGTIYPGYIKYLGFFVFQKYQMINSDSIYM